MHLHHVQRRWSDLDMLKHVNNVRFLDWSKDALMAAQSDGALPIGSLWPSSLKIDYRRPVHLSDAPVMVETTFADETGVIDQCVTEQAQGERVVCASIEIGVGDAPAGFQEPVRQRRPYPCFVRRSEADAAGRVDFARYVEYTQEARIYSIGHHPDHQAMGSAVVASIRARLGSPLRWRPEPYEVHTWVAHLGRSSAVFVSQIRDGDRVLQETSSVLVAFDLETQRPRPYDEIQRALLKDLSA